MLDAVIEIARQPASAAFPHASSFAGMFDTALARGEIVAAIRIPPETARAGAAYEKLSLVAGDFAIVSVAAIVGTDVRVAIGGCRR